MIADLLLLFLRLWRNNQEPPLTTDSTRSARISQESTIVSSLGNSNHPQEVGVLNRSVHCTNPSYLGIKRDDDNNNAKQEEMNGGGINQLLLALGKQIMMTKQEKHRISNPALQLETGADHTSTSTDPVFHSKFRPEDMRLLALVSHNNMKDSMKEFVTANKNVLKKFRLTGTNTTMTMLKSIFRNDPEIVYGPSCTSGPLGGDAQLVAMAATGQLGGCIFFIDPMDTHPHNADIDCLCRQGNVHNILMMNNPCTAHITMNTLRFALEMGRKDMIPSFFMDMESPSVLAYKEKQRTLLISKELKN